MSEREKAEQQAHQPEEPLHLDDLHVGQRFTSGTYVMEEARIKEFAAEFDPQPFHLDKTAAEASVFKGLSASGWHHPGGANLDSGVRQAGAQQSFREGASADISLTHENNIRL